VVGKSDHPIRDHAILTVTLGPLETQAMEILWTLRRTQGAGRDGGSRSGFGPHDGHDYA
jgi:hypothetical protein